MAWASRSGRARVSSSHPEAFGVCQRCGIWYQRRELRNQVEWMGATMLPTWLFVCQRCYDTPQEQNRAFIPPADPIPIQLALPENFEVSNELMGLNVAPQAWAVMGEVDLTTIMATTKGEWMAENQLPGQVPLDPIVGIPVPDRTAMRTSDGVLMAPTPTGRPPGYDALAKEPVTPRAVLMAKTDGTYMVQAGGAGMAERGPGGPDSGTVQPFPDEELPIPEGVQVPVLSLLADDTPLVRATCRAPHGLVLNSQVFVRGSVNSLADGIFSVIPLTATVFTYGAYSPVPAGSMLRPETIVLAVEIGLPHSHPMVPQTGLPQSRPTKTSQ